MIEIRNVSKSFGSLHVLRGVSLTIETGQNLVVLGRSGTGKSVLLKLIIGLLPLDDGEILVDGRSVHRLAHRELDELRQRMGMLFQMSALFDSMTVGENVGLALKEHTAMSPPEIADIVEEKLRMVGLEGIAGKRPSELSGGMRKRAAIARALVIEPQLILYDEPTSELDPLSAVIIAEEIVSLNQRTGVTSLVVSHDRELAFGVADRVAVIHEGRILTIGTPEQVSKCAEHLVREFLSAGFKRNSS